MVVTKTLNVKTRGNCDIIDITPEVAKEVVDSGLNDGVVTIFARGSTAALSTIENESGLMTDFKAMWERLVPSNIGYNHDRAWGDGNGHSHMRASLLGPSLTIPFKGMRMFLGTWQQIVYVDFDNRPRSREIILQIMGE
jgi:secondary thiamine-phosphate synthase enzyme